MENIKVQKKLFKATILANFPLRRPGLQGNYLIQLLVNKAVKCKPGYFFKFDLSEQIERRPLKIVEAKDDHTLLQINSLTLDHDFLRRQPIIARPYSVGLCEAKTNKTLLTFIYKILGPGSTRLSELEPGKKLIVLGPLGGDGFYLPKGKRRALMVAGGVGLPPLLFLSRLLLRKGITAIHLFIGANTSDKLPLHADFEHGKAIADPQSLPEVFRHLADPRMTIRISTDDGSEGHQGLATQLLEEHLRGPDDRRETVVYACGPWKMMARTAQIARQNNLPCQVCLEEMMGCGIGACQSCAVRIKSDSPKGWQYKLVCRDGPVFDADIVDWEKNES